MSALPQWAYDRAKVLAEAEASCDLGNGQSLLALSCYQMALARLVAAHEEPPVDPLLIEARKLVAARYAPTQFPAIQATLDGQDDAEQSVQNCLIALRRGMELAQSTEEPKP